MRVWVIYEQDEDSGDWSAYSLDVPGCVAAAATREEIETLIREALEFHIEGLTEDGEPLPEPATKPWAEQVDIAV